MTKQYAISFSNDLHDELMEFASKNEMTKAEIIRHALAAYFAIQKLDGENEKLAIVDADNKIIKRFVFP